MDNDITAFIGLDVHKDSIAVAVAAPGRGAPHFVGTTGPQLTELLKALKHLAQPEQALIAYEAGPVRVRSGARAWRARLPLRGDCGRQDAAQARGTD
jgi:hypothetical protein